MGAFLKLRRRDGCGGTCWTQEGAAAVEVFQKGTLWDFMLWWCKGLSNKEIKNLTLRSCQLLITSLKTRAKVALNGVCGIVAENSVRKKSQQAFCLTCQSGLVYFLSFCLFSLLPLFFCETALFMLVWLFGNFCKDSDFFIFDSMALSKDWIFFPILVHCNDIWNVLPLQHKNTMLHDRQ